MVIPAAAGIVLTVLAGLGLAIMLYIGASLMASTVAWLMIRAKESAGRIPLVGVPVAGLVNLLWGTTQEMLFSVERWAESHLWWMHHHMRLVLHYFLTPVFMTVFSQLAFVFSLAVYILDGRVAPLEDNFNRVWALANAVAAQIEYVLHVRVEALEGNFNRLRDLTSELVARLDYLLHGRIEPLEGNFNNLRDLTSELVARTVELEAFLPLLRTLARFETETVGGIERLGGRVAELEKGEADLFRDLAKVLPLSVIAALGAVAVRELADTAVNPCRCLDIDAFNNLGDRVSALEVAVG